FTFASGEPHLTVSTRSDHAFQGVWPDPSRRTRKNRRRFGFGRRLRRGGVASFQIIPRLVRIQVFIAIGLRVPHADLAFRKAGKRPNSARTMPQRMENSV